MNESFAVDVRLQRTCVLETLGVATSSCSRQPTPVESKKRPSPAPEPIAASIRRAELAMATANAWYGCKRILVLCLLAGCAVQDRQIYAVMRDAGRLPKLRPR